MRLLDEFGEPGFLVVPSRLHRYDAFIWKQRYPQLVVVAPSGARTRVEEVVHVDTSSPDFDDSAVRFVEVNAFVVKPTFFCSREASSAFQTSGYVTLRSR